MAFEALCCLRRTIHRLQKSSRISLESPRILTSEQTGVESTLKLVRFLQDFKDGIGSKKMGDLEGEIREAARELEDVVDSHVSDLILGSENRVLLLDLQGVRHDFDEFIEKMKKIERVYNPWFYEEQELDHIFGSTSDGHVITRARFVSWFADKAASVFMGVKEEYIQDLQNYQLWPEDDDGKEYALLLSDFNENEEDDEKDNDFHVRVKDGLTRWWMDRVCSISAMDEECIQEIEQPLAEVDEVGVNMVGLADLFCKIRNEFLQGLYPYSYAVITGMAGIGKTALAKSKFKDPLIISKFQHCVFVRVGQKYQEEQVIQAIAAQLNAEMLLIKDGDQEDVFEFVYKTLQNGKYLIVLDDVWDKDLFLDFIDRLPYNEGSWVLLTTRIDDLYEYGFTTFQVPFLSLDESWDLLRRNIFGEDQLCPPQLVKAGMKIAENCEGLPLLILTVARLLFEADNMSPEYWNNVAANKTNSIFVAGYELMLDVARPSYNHLPHHLKTCFLYMGAFPQNATVRISKLINLWSAEGFLDLPYTELQLQVGKYFDKLVSENNVALECERGNYGSDLRACSLHSVFWYLCKLVGWDEEFLHVLNVWYGEQASSFHL